VKEEEDKRLMKVTYSVLLTRLSVLEEEWRAE
jgi:hypothetical protein